MIIKSVREIHCIYCRQKLELLEYVGLEARLYGAPHACEEEMRVLEALVS